MLSELTDLRDQIDEVDKFLLKILAKRLNLVTKIGKLKNIHGLPIYIAKREAKILKARRKEAKMLGVSPDLIDDLLRRIMRESLFTEHKKGFKTLCPELHSIVIIGGNGKMGQLFKHLLTLSGYQVKVLDIEDWSRAEQLLKNVGLVIVSVPPYSTDQVITQIPPLPDDCILMDLTSIKNRPLKSMLAIHRGPVLGLHPMFEPNIHCISKQVIAYCDGRYPEDYQWLLEQIKLWGVRLRRVNADEHDQNIVFIQVLHHFITFAHGLHLVEEDAKLDQILSLTSPMHRLQFMMIAQFFAGDPRLCSDIIVSLKEYLVPIKSYYHHFGEVIKFLENSDKKIFIKTFKKVSHWFGAHKRRLLIEGDRLLRHANDSYK